MLLSTDSPSLASRGTQRSNISLSKVEPLIDNEFLELISNPGSAKGSRNVSPTPVLGDQIQAFKPVGNGLLNLASDGFLGMENVNAADSDGLSAIHRAVRVDDAAAVVSLLDNGTDINLSDKSGFTPLHAAARYVHVLNLYTIPLTSFSGYFLMYYVTSMQASKKKSIPAN